MQPLVLINTVGLTSRHLQHAPNLMRLAQSGWHRPLREVTPAVTCTAQASMLTGKTPQEHGIVGNGWFWRDTGEVRFWLQSNRLIQCEPLYVTAKRHATERGRTFHAAKLFWWFNQGADVSYSVTPKPHYGSDGNKLFDVTGHPTGFSESLTNKLGPFPFPTFWGPMAGLPCTQWIGECAGQVLADQKPDLTLVYLPHLDYDTQRLGPDGCDWKKLVGELDQAIQPIIDNAKKIGARIWVVNECTHGEVNQAVFPNRLLRQAGMLQAKRGPFGEMLDTFDSRALAVCDHQIAHVYVKHTEDIPRIRDLFQDNPSIEKIYCAEERQEIALHTDRAGDVILLSKPNAWFAYPYWEDDRMAPDFARTVNIHAKPGYDPCELFFDPKLWWPKGRAIRRLIQKKLGFRTLFDVVPLDTSLVKGSHGLPVSNDEDRPVMIGDGPVPGDGSIEMTQVRDLVLKALDLL